MRTVPVDILRRRTLLGAAAIIASVPLSRIGLIGTAQASELPHLSEDDPAAKALNYHQDATAAPRTDKSEIAASEQFCHRCNFIQADSGEWRPCKIFPGKAVNANGWCASWMPRTG